MMSLVLQALLLSGVHGFVPLGGIPPVSRAPVRRRSFSPWTTTTTTTTTTTSSKVVGNVLFMAPTNTTAAAPPPPRSRFDRADNRDMHSPEECILEIDGQRYNLTAWAKAHPGGVKVLHKFHNKDASEAFHAAAHSTAAYAMLKEFLIPNDDNNNNNNKNNFNKNNNNNNNEPAVATTPVDWTTVTLPTESTRRRQRPRWIQKLFTKEDPIGVHKYLGVFCLLNFIYRFGHMYVGDPTAGFGSATRTPWSVLSLIPHAILSLSSLLFHTVPRERVVGKPMIWQEYRIHNIGFGIRSVVCGGLAWMAYHVPQSRKLAVVTSCLAALLAMMVADYGTHRYQPSALESTTATMPYWDGCSLATQKRFKLFYAYSQFMATLACIAVSNPAWPLAVLLAIQCASLLMTLVRKGILSAEGYHIGYTITLAMPYLVGLRNGFAMGHATFPAMLAVGAALFSLRRSGINKYALWTPILGARILVGDRFIPYTMW